MFKPAQINFQELYINDEPGLSIETPTERKPILIITNNGQISFSNQFAQNLFGVNEGQSVSTLQTNVDIKKFLTDFIESDYSIINLNIRIKTNNETEIQEYLVDVEKFELSNSQYLFLTFHLTAKEQVLESRINSIHTAIEFANIPIMILDSKGKINYISSSMENLLNLSLEELYGKFVCVSLENILPKADLLTAERSIYLKQSWVKVTSIRNKKSIVFKELRLTPFYNSVANEDSFILIANDITDYIQKNNFIKESEKKLKAIINNIVDPLFILRKTEGKIFFESGNSGFFKLFNFDKSKLNGAEVINLFNNGILKLVIENLYYIIKSTDSSLEFKSKYKLTHYACKITAMDISNKDDQYFLISFSNITEQENYQSKMIAAYQKELHLNKLKTNFIENMSHEIRTPFNAISGYSEILEECIQSNDYNTISELLVLVKEVLTRVSYLFDQIIEMSEIEAGEIVFDYVYLNYNQVLHSVYNKLKYKADRKNLKLELELSEQEILIKTDWVKLEKIVIAVVENAIKFSSQGKIVIRSYDFNEYAYISIIDTGDGMNQDDIKFLLEPFSQEEQGYTRNYQGAGLGLAIASRLTKMMGGRFEIVSRKQAGTKVNLIFPVTKIT